MKAITRDRSKELRAEFEKVLRILEDVPAIDRNFSIATTEFADRQKKVWEALAQAGLAVGFVFSDEHYDGDVPYLGGNTNISVEQVAGLIGPGGFHIVAGLEGGYIAEQLAKRANAVVHKVEMLKLADEDYPIRAERLADVVARVAGGKAGRIGLLSPRQVIPASLVEHLEGLAGKENVVDAQELYYKIKYEKSEAEMRLIADASVIGDAMLAAMLAVLRPGMLETEVAAWGYFVAKELGAEEMGWDIIVGANEANRTLIGKALNRVINEGDYVHLGVAPKRDGLNSCVRRSVIAVDSPDKVTEEQRYWFNLVEGAYEVGYQEYCDVAKRELPARLQEAALVEYFKSKADEVSRRIGKRIELQNFKPYTGTHSSGYTECQEFYGAITLGSNTPLGKRIVTMLDVALRGYGDRWDDVVIPDFDYLVIENTLGKYGDRVETLNKLPINVQHLVGR